MTNDRKKELKEQYEKRHPRMGIICWQSGEKLWADMSRNADGDYNSTSFQLKLGSWPNRELQSAFTAAPESFSFSLVKELEYEDYSEDHTDDLKILLMDYLREHPDAKPMRVKFNL